jgi:hypothetical protein
LAVARATPPAIRWWKRKRARTDSVERVGRRLERKKEVEAHLQPRSEYGIRGEAIIRDVHRADRYPDVDAHGFGISPWFKVEVKDVYHRGLEVLLSANYISLDKRKRTWEIVYRAEEADLKGYVVGRIPFDWIAQVDWDGDEYYAGPHIYCRFIGKQRQPYEEILVYYKAKDSEIFWELQGGYRPARHRLASLKARLLRRPRWFTRARRLAS